MPIEAWIHERTRKLYVMLEFIGEEKESWIWYWAILNETKTKECCVVARAPRLFDNKTHVSMSVRKINLKVNQTKIIKE
jgi:hypothetical protein